MVWNWGAWRDRIKGRHRHGRLARWAVGAGVGAWKFARCLPGASRIHVTVPCDGHRLRVRLFSYDDLLTASADYEAALAELLPPSGGVAIDVGAFIGRYTLSYARAVGPQGLVLAIEPLEANYRLLMDNICRNGYDHVIAAPVAAGKQEGLAELAYDRETSTASLVYPLSRRVDVPLKTLDALCRDHAITRVDLLKVDVEGAELDVLAGASTILRQNPAVELLIEVHESRRFRHSTAGPLRDYLADHGFACQELTIGARLFYLARRPEAAVRRER